MMADGGWDGTPLWGPNPYYQLVRIEICLGTYPLFRYPYGWTVGVSWHDRNGGTIATVARWHAASPRYHYREYRWA